MIDPMGRQGRPGQQGLPCPECGALRAPDNTPSCSCAQRAAEALRDTRTAEAAAAEDFDPLRIRPYVELEGEQRSATGAGAGPEASSVGSDGRDGPDGELTMPLPAVPADATMPLRAVDPAGPAPDATAALPTPLTPPASEPSTSDLSLFEAADVGTVHPDDEEPHGPRRRRTLLVASAAAVVAVVAAAGFASGLFSYEKPTRDSAAPEDVRAAVPAPSAGEASKSPSASRSASPSASDVSPSPSPPPSESESPSPSAPEESVSLSPSPSVTAGQATPTPRASASTGPDNGADNSEPISEGTVLRRGDTGTEVTELQLRLSQLFFYNGEADGTFDSEVEDALRNYQWSRGTTADGLGVYGALTRARLESETKEP